MGFSIAWVAIEKGRIADIAAVLDVRLTDEADEAFESPLTGVTLETGWYLVIGRGSDNRIISPENLKKLSAEHRCVAVSVEEHVMYSGAQLWETGKLVWQVSHDAQKGMFHLESAGSLPSSLESLKERTFSEQRKEGGESAEVDYIFDIPLIAAQEITGFKHDVAELLFAEIPQVMEGRVSSRPWWKFW